MTQDLLGNQIEQSTKIKKLINEIINEVSGLNNEIKGPREPDPAKQKASDDKIARGNSVRGRPFFYPYMGTGSGNGPYVELEDGSVKLDLINGIGIHILGHGHPNIIQACLEGALSDIVMQGHLQANKEYLNFGEKIISLASKKSKIAHAWLCTCGTIANENALKLVRQKKSPARFIIGMEKAFAGRSTMMAELTDNPSYKEGLPEYNEVLRIPFYNPEDKKSSEKSLRIFKEHVAKNEGNICAFSFEPMLGEGGYVPAPREYFVPILDFCKEKGIPVWADEVQTFTRTGELFAFETLDLGKYIDVCTIAKTAQLAVTLFTDEYNPKPGLIAGTFAASTGSLRAGMTVLDFLTNGGYLGPNGKILQIHHKFVSMLNELNQTTCKGMLRDAGGLGLMIAATPHNGSKEKQLELLKCLYKNGLMTFGCGRDPYRIRFLVPAIMQDKDIEVAKRIIEKSILETK